MGLSRPIFLDCGNSRIKFRFQRELGCLTLEQLTDYIKKRQVTELVFSSVSSLGDELVGLATSLSLDWFQAKVEQEFDGLHLIYENTENLGVDRWLAMIGARALQPGADVWVVDAGTALTMDLVTCEGAHKGGFIAPGLSMGQRALFENTTRLPMIELKPVEKLGTDTDSCINYGLVRGAVALIESTMVQSDQFDSNLLITGGDAEIISQSISVKAEICPNLVLDGLFTYWKKRTEVA